MFLNDLFYIEELSYTGNRLEANIRFNPGHRIFAGHFPGSPVVPGVCLLEVIKETLGQVVQKELSLIAASSIKFLQMIDPTINTEVHLSGTFVQNQFGIIKAEISITAGKAVFLKMKASFDISFTSLRN